MCLITDKRILAIFSVLYSLGSSVYGSNPYVLPVMYSRYGFYRGKVFYQIRSYERWYGGYRYLLAHWDFFCFGYPRF